MREYRPKMEKTIVREELLKDGLRICTGCGGVGTIEGMGNQSKCRPCKRKRERELRGGVKQPNRLIENRGLGFLRCSDCSKILQISEFNIKRTSIRCRGCERKVQSAYKRNREINDPAFKLKNKFYVRVYHAIRRIKEGKATSTYELSGCSWESLKAHLERKFKRGMTWENYGSGWHVDHIIPCAKFDLSKDIELRRCFHFSNLQPLWASANYTKGDKCENAQPSLML